jgi:hypothetical protein
MAGGTVRALRVAGLVACLAACGGEEPAREASGDFGEAAATPRANAAPRVDHLELRPEAGSTGERVQVLAQVSDPDGDRMFVGYRWEVDGLAAEVSGPEIRLLDVPKGARVRVTVTAGDGTLVSEPVSAEFRVRNSPPEIRNLVLQPTGDVFAGQTVSILPRTHDADGDALEHEFTWYVNGNERGTGDHTFSTRGLRRGDRVGVRVVASDGEDRSDPLEGAAFEIANAPPSILSQPPAVGPDGHFRYRPEVQDADGDRPLRFRLDESPPGMQLDPADGELSWQASVEHQGTFPVVLVVEDVAGGKAEQRFELIVDVVPGEAAPAASAD